MGLARVGPSAPDGRESGPPRDGGLAGVLFYLYCDNVAATRSAFESAGVAVGRIEYPFYAPRGEFRVSDPDGYVLMVTHT